MEFKDPPPSRLIKITTEKEPGTLGSCEDRAQPQTEPTEEHRYIANWCVDDVQEGGLTKSQVAEFLGSIFDDSRGWKQANITFNELTGSACEDQANKPVTYKYVNEAYCPGEDEAGCTTRLEDGSVLVTIEVSRFGKIKVVNHETAHAFFWATHTGDGVMNTPGQPSVEWPTENDMTTLKQWLGVT